MSDSHERSGAAQKRFQPTLRTRLALWYGGLTLVAGIVLVTVTTAAAISAVSVSADSVRVVATSGDGASSMNGQVTDDPVPGATLPPGSTLTVTGPDGAGETSTRVDGEAINSLIQKSVAAQNTRIRDSVVRSVLWWSLASLVLVVISAIAVGWVVGKRALEPLHRMTETVRRVAGDNLGERVALDGPDDEIKVLADTFDAMLERLDHSFDAQRNFVANASHELRTPLTISRTVLEVALADSETSPDLREVGQSLLQVTDRNERLIDGLLTLAAADREPRRTPSVSLTDIVTVVTRGAATDDGPTVHADLGATPILVDGDEILLERLVQNLVDNACRYNVEDGFVTVALRSTDGTATLVVENSGPLIPAHEASTLFEPFRRLDRRGQREDRSAGYLKGGVGLGLSIVRSVAEAHHGGASATPREGGGLVVTVSLPQRSAVSRTLGTSWAHGTIPRATPSYTGD